MELLRATTLFGLLAFPKRNLDVEKASIPDGEYLAITAVVLAASTDSQPMPSVINGMRGIERGLEHHAGFDFPRNSLTVFFIVTPLLIVLTKGVGVNATTRYTRSTGPCGGLEFTRALPFGTPG